MEPTRIVIPYCPRPFQRSTMDAMRRFNVLPMHRRFGKTVLCVNRLIRKAITCQHPNPRVAYFAPFLKQAKQVAWDYVKHYTRPIPGMKINNSELYAEFPNGARLQLFGADNPDRARGIYLDDCVLDEYAQMAPSMFGEIIRPALSDRLGGCTFIGTPKGKGAFWKLYELARTRMAEGDPDWYAAILRASETGVIPDHELNKLRREMRPEEYEQEYECSWQAAIRGAYWGAEMELATKENRVGIDVPYVPDYPVHMAWDLGMADALIIWFYQTINGQRRYLNVKEYHQGLPDVCADIVKQPYSMWGNHVFPHDIAVGELGTGLRRWDIVRRLLQGKGNCVKCRNIPRRDGIEAVRLSLARSVFDRKCNEACNGLSLYRAEYDEIYEITNANPVHDWTSHYADAIRYGVVYDRGYGDETKGPQLDLSAQFASTI